MSDKGPADIDLLFRAAIDAIDDGTINEFLEPLDDEVRLRLHGLAMDVAKRLNYPQVWSRSRRRYVCGRELAEIARTNPRDLAD